MLAEGMPMKTIREKEFEYYEEKAAYFQYTHERDYAEEYEISQDYLNLNPKVIEAVKKKARIDNKAGKEKMTVRQLEEYLLDEGIIKYGETAPVIDDLYVDYEMEFYV